MNQPFLKAFKTSLIYRLRLRMLRNITSIYVNIDVKPYNLSISEILWHYSSHTPSQARTHSWVSGSLYRCQADICSGEGRGGGEKVNNAVSDRCYTGTKQ